MAIITPNPKTVAYPPDIDARFYDSTINFSPPTVDVVDIRGRICRADRPYSFSRLVLADSVALAASGHYYGVLIANPIFNFATAPVIQCYFHPKCRPGFEVEAGKLYYLSNQPGLGTVCEYSDLASGNIAVQLFYGLEDGFAAFNPIFTSYVVL